VKTTDRGRFLRELISCWRPVAVIAAVLRLIRPHQWSKNLLVLAPVIISHKWGEADAWIAAATGAIAFCFAASSTYVLNDWLDREADRQHPDKCHRPFASGSLKSSRLLWLVPLLASASIAIAWSVNRSFLMVDLIYLAISWSYCFFIRGWLWLDALALAALYTLRVVAGVYAISVEPSPWLLGFSIFIFFSLAAAKRQQDLSVAGIESHQRAYRPEDRPVVLAIGSATGVAAVLVLALYINSEDMLMLYRYPMWLWMMCPLLLYWLARLWTLAYRGELHADPVLFALRDRVSWVVALLGMICIALAT
jgi:4-hydroxybenzoate polyprenyltransferase